MIVSPATWEPPPPYRIAWVGSRRLVETRHLAPEVPGGLGGFPSWDLRSDTGDRVGESLSDPIAQLPEIEPNFRILWPWVLTSKYMYTTGSAYLSLNAAGVHSLAFPSATGALAGCPPTVSRCTKVGAGVRFCSGETYWPTAPSIPSTQHTVARFRGRKLGQHLPRHEPISVAPRLRARHLRHSFGTVNRFSPRFPHASRWFYRYNCVPSGFFLLLPPPVARHVLTGC